MAREVNDELTGKIIDRGIVGLRELMGMMKPPRMSKSEKRLTS